MFSSSRSNLAIRASLALTLSSVFLVSCSAVTGPKVTMEELREYYGPYQELFDAAVQSQNTEHLKAIIDFGVSEQDFYGAILDSIAGGYKESTDYLLTYGKNNNNRENFIYGLNNWIRQNENYTPYIKNNFYKGNALGWALQNDNYKVVEQLIDIGVNVEKLGGNNLARDFYFTPYLEKSCVDLEDHIVTLEYRTKYKWKVSPSVQSKLEERGISIPPDETEEKQFNNRFNYCEKYGGLK